jgi:segregation and condensation protein B
VTPSERQVAEAILLVADEPLNAGALGEVLEIPRVQAAGLLEQLAREYERDERGFVLRETEAGWRLFTRPDCAPWLERFVLGHRKGRLTPAALEVLAIIAYRGPISRSQIAELRGVDSDGVVRTLLTHGLIAEAGHDAGPGSPVLFRVGDVFLERMGLRSTDDLPPLADFVPDIETVEDMEAKLSPRA